MKFRGPGTLIILTPGFPSDEGDTSCLPAQQVFVRALNRTFPELTVVVLTLEYPHRAAEYKWFGNKVISFGGWKAGKLNKLSTLMVVWRRLGKLRREHELIGLLSFWCGPCALLGRHFGRRNNIPQYTWILGQDARAGNGLMPLIRPKAEGLVAMSKFLAEEFNRNYRIVPRHIIPNGVEPALFSPGFDHRDIDVLGAGNLTTLKQYDRMVRIVFSLRQQLHFVKGVICGKGPEGGHLKEMIQTADLEGSLQLVGEKPHREVLEYMQRTRIFLHTSSYEGFSTVCLEALYAGAQVISFCDPMGVPVKNWHVVGSEEEMLEKALQLLKDPEMRNESVRLFTMDESARAMMGLYGYE